MAKTTNKTSWAIALAVLGAGAFFLYRRKSAGSAKDVAISDAETAAADSDLRGGSVLAPVSDSTDRTGSVSAPATDFGTGFPEIVVQETFPREETVFTSVKTTANRLLRRSGFSA